MSSRSSWVAPTLVLGLVASQTQACGLEGTVPLALLPAAAAGGLAVGGVGAWLVSKGQGTPGPVGSTSPLSTGGGGLVHDGGVVFFDGQPNSVSTNEGSFTTEEVNDLASLSVSARQIALMLSNTQQDRVPLAPPAAATSEASYRLVAYGLSQSSPPPCELDFTKADGNGDRRLDLNEFRAMAKLRFPAMGPAEVDAKFKEAEANLDGFIDPAEYCRRFGAPPPSPNPGPGGTPPPECTDKLKAYDTVVQDGFLDAEEWYAFKKGTAPQPVSSPEAQAEFAKLDGNQDFKIGPFELCQALGVAPPPPGAAPSPLALPTSAPLPGASVPPPPLSGPATDPNCLARFNRDADPKVSFGEYAFALTGQAQPAPVLQEAIKASFLRLDANSDGQLDAFELCGRGPLAPVQASPPEALPSGGPSLRPQPLPVLAKKQGEVRADGSLNGRFTFPGEAGIQDRAIVYQAPPATERRDAQGITQIERSYQVEVFGVANTVVVTRPKEEQAVPELGIRWRPAPTAGEVAIQVRANAAEVQYPSGGKASLSALALSGGALQSQGSMTDAQGRQRDVAVGLLADGRTSCTVSERRFAVQMLFDPAGRGSGAIVDARGVALGQLSIGTDGKVSVQLSSGARGTLTLRTNL